MNIEEDLVKTIETHRGGESIEHSPTTTEKKVRNKEKFNISILKNNKVINDVSIFEK